MTNGEKVFFDVIKKNLNLLLVLLITFFAMFIRFSFLNYVSDDMSTFLLPWYDQMQRGRIAGLAHGIGEYNIPYQVFIALLTFLPIKPLYGFKLFSILFDFLLGVAVACTVWKISGDKFKAILAYAVVICMPMVFLNSSMWGQCDSIYVFFCVLSLLFLLTEKYSLCFISFGAALGFKLQALFILPFILLIYVKEERFSLWKIIFAPLTMIVMSLPALLAGRSIADIFSLYTQQTGIYPEMSVNYPSFWNLIFYNRDRTWYDLFSGVAVALTILILIVFFRSL